MPFNVPLSRVLRKAGWRAKVFDEEGPETPHLTIQFKTERIWRVSLRNGTFIVPPGGRLGDMPDHIESPSRTTGNNCGRTGTGRIHTIRLKAVTMSSVTSKPTNRITKQFVVLDSSKSFRTRLGEQWSMQVRRRTNSLDVLRSRRTETVWIVAKSDWTEPLLEAVSFVFCNIRRA